MQKVLLSMAGCVTWCGYPALYLRGYSAKKEVPMNKDEMVNILSQRTGFMKKDSEVMLDAVFPVSYTHLTLPTKLEV